jgi:hypothetical protein
MKSSCYNIVLRQNIRSQKTVLYLGFFLRSHLLFALDLNSCTSEVFTRNSEDQNAQQKAGFAVLQL